MDDNISTYLHTVVFAGLPRQRSEATTDKLRILGDLLDDVLQGLRTAAEASALYGVQTSGRKRRFSTFADYVTDRIAYAESAAAEHELRDLLTRAGNALRYRSSQATSALTVRVNRLLDETGAERAARLRELLADLTN